MAQAPELSELGNAIREVGDIEVHSADSALNQARRDEKLELRTGNLNKADNALVEAIRKLEAQRQENDRLAKERLGRAKLDRPAEEQKKLADQTAKAAKEKTEKLQRQPKDIHKQQTNSQ